MWLYKDGQCIVSTPVVTGNVSAGHSTPSGSVWAVSYTHLTASAGTIKYFDYSLLFIIIFLVGFGLVMLYSVSAYEGQSVFNDPTHYLKRQVFSVGLGFIGMFVFTYFPQKWMKKDVYKRQLHTGMLHHRSFL